MTSTYKITEWDESQEPGSYAFELLMDGRVSVYVIRFMDGTYKHLSNNFTDITETISTREASAREITVASYMASNAHYFNA